ncbi:MAG: carbohydrate kinase [Saprospiraceae bacterium]|nr:carbohydrate kinase [Saprospiraceae bacterium]
MTSKEDIIKAIKSFKDFKVLVIGDVMVDSYLMGNVERISPEAPVPIVSVHLRMNRLGGAANVAMNIRAFGAEAILCSVIGEDAAGDDFINLLDKRNLSAEGIIKSKNRLTTTKFRVIGNNTQMLRFDEEVEYGLNVIEQKEYIKKIKDIIENKKIDVIIFEDYDKGVINENLIRIVTEFAHKHQIPVVADPKRKNFKAYKNIDLFKPNLKELKEGLNLYFDHKNQEELSSAVQLLKIKQTPKVVMVTLSENGVYISNDKEKHIIPAHIRNISDVSGAGDTVISVAALCIAAKLPLDTLATIANLAGGLVCEEVGVVPVNKDKLIDEINKL